MIKVFRVIIDDLKWPEMQLSISSGLQGEEEIARVSPWDIAMSNFEMPIRNILQRAVQDIIQQRKERRYAEPVEQRIQDIEDSQRIQSGETALRLKKRANGKVKAAGSRNSHQLSKAQKVKR